MAYTVYKHTSPSGKVYIGITSRPVQKRWQNGTGYKQHRYFNAAIQKYGWQNFTHEILFSNLSKSDACEKEKELIMLYNSTDRRFGYNQSTGGESGACGVCPSQETREKIRRAKLGKKQSPEAIEKTRQANIGKRLSQETKDKISKSKKGKKYGKMPQERIEKLKKSLIGRTSPMLGKKQTDEAKIKIGNANRGRKFTEEQLERMRISHLGQKNEHSMRKIYCEETGIVYESVAKACLETNISRKSVIDVCRGRKGSVKGMHFTYWEAE